MRVIQIVVAEVRIVLVEVNIFFVLGEAWDTAAVVVHSQHRTRVRSDFYRYKLEHRTQSVLIVHIECTIWNTRLPHPYKHITSVKSAYQQ